MCSFSIAFWECLDLFYFYLRFIKNFQIIREKFPFFSQFFTIHLNCGVVAIVRNPGGRHSQALVGYATLPRFCTKLCFLGFLCLTKPAFMRRPWRITPCPAVHGWAFLAFRHNPTDSKHLRYAPLQEYVCASCTRGLRALRCSFNDKWLILCFFFFFFNYNNQVLIPDRLIRIRANV